jgi:hypothetical protein
LFNPDRNRAAVRSPEARQDRGHRSSAKLRRGCCLVGSPARLPARRHTRPAGPRAQRWCRASAGHGCDGRLDDGYGSLMFLPHAPRGGEPGVRRPSWVYYQWIDEAWFHSEALRHETTVRRRPRGRLTGAGRPRRSSSWPRRSAPSCSPGRPQPASAAGAATASAATPSPICYPALWRA